VNGSCVYCSMIYFIWGITKSTIDRVKNNERFFADCLNRVVIRDRYRNWSATTNFWLSMRCRMWNLQSQNVLRWICDVFHQIIVIQQTLINHAHSLFKINGSRGSLDIHCILSTVCLRLVARLLMESCSHRWSSYVIS
jgi:hypothetical protein